LRLDGGRVRDLEVGVEQSLEPESLVLRFGIGSSERAGQSRSDGIRYRLGSSEQRVGRRRVDDVEVGREFVLGEGDDVGQVEWVRELSDDRRGRIQGCIIRCNVESGSPTCLKSTYILTEPDRDTFRTIHDNAVEGLHVAAKGRASG